MERLRRWLVAKWFGAAPPAALRPLEALFAGVVALRRAAYRCGLLRAGHPGVPVIVVGNIVVGGTGKTPLVLWLVQQLQALGLRPGVASRGHGARHPRRAPRLVDAEDVADEVGDEAVMLARRAECPVCVGVDRLAVARLLAAQGCTVVVADDGLQHYPLGRDLEIAVLDGARGLGNGALLPAGPLREPPARLLEVDAVVINGPLSRPLDGLAVGEKTFRMALRPRQFVRLDSGEAASVVPWQGRRVHAVAGIGNPAAFFATLRALGLEVAEHAFPDHHRFRVADLAFGDDRDIVMTEKDAVKCATFASARMWFLSAAMELDTAEATRLMALVRGRIEGRLGT